jgi:hypothetical protein
MSRPLTGPLAKVPTRAARLVPVVPIAAPVDPELRVDPKSIPRAPMPLALSVPRVQEPPPPPEPEPAPPPQAERTSAGGRRILHADLLPPRSETVVARYRALFSDVRALKPHEALEWKDPKPPATKDSIYHLLRKWSTELGFKVRPYWPIEGGVWIVRGDE